MRTRRHFLADAGMLLGATACSASLFHDPAHVHAEPPAGDRVGVALFNGRNLDGWVLVNTPADTWSIQDGMLVCSGKPTGEIRTERMYQNFELEVEWRHMVPGGNAGIFVWADDITARGVPFHRSVEVQVLDHGYGSGPGHTTHGDIFPIHGATMEPVNGRGGNRAFPSEERALPSPQWNHYRIVCQDGNIQLAVNGKVVTEGRQSNPSKGYICIESEGGVVQYRGLWLRERPDTPVAPERIATQDRGFRSLYSGLDLRGWKPTDQGGAAWKPEDWVLRFDGSVTREASRLESTTDYELSGFVMDFRFGEASRGLELALPGSGKALRIQPQDDATFAKDLQPTGDWNRLEATRVDGQMRLTANGSPTLLTIPAGRGRLVIQSEGPVDLANLYVR